MKTFSYALVVHIFVMIAIINANISRYKYWQMKENTCEITFDKSTVSFSSNFFLHFSGYLSVPKVFFTKTSACYSVKTKFS